MKPLLDIIHNELTDDWSEKNQQAFQSLFGANGGRYPDKAKKSVALRAPGFNKGSTGVPFSAYIHPSNPDSGAYGGMSFVLFPVEDAPCLVALVVGTQGLSPDEEVLSRPGHGRKVAAICRWLNRSVGQGQMVAWAKQEPVRTDLDVPDGIRRMFPAYRSVFDRYGKVIYGFYAPTTERQETERALKAFLDLFFSERGQYPLKAAEAEAERIRGDYFAHLMPDASEEEVRQLLAERRFVILQGPPGTGKTRMALRLKDAAYGGSGLTVQFHANTTYEQFVGGLAPLESDGAIGLQFAPRKGFLMEAAEAAQATFANGGKPYLLHIDEINRADLAKVLGEAIYLLEAQAETPRRVSLPYDFGAPFGRELSLPENLHILGTMNSADRSIAIVDVAVRRRFAFVKLWPQYRVVESQSGPLMKKAFIDLLSIFVEYASDDALALVPGHSYFLEADDRRAAQKLRTNLAPLLEEYLAQGYVAGFEEAIRSYLQWVESL
ncbi:GTPase subunit of restriction endonuclease, putative [Heliomicrobium modesticaldum Ice1]|uniref:GTPase subunit of restriction endonuclease, putative n=1 Tax=Heliobacterium modesticaldum (strain ATCC 51547 / Ice1) TaxID=498761 RepID=B0TG78_HELMI|nr:AAA family ATPase [Heliomicrobium modesticaldum]ABZ84574.1 GTPase subunit of restriction endonuclease, putative [Heliomicrobium modesticaldum Ice1]